MPLAKKLRLYAGEGGEPALNKACDPATSDKASDQKEEAAQAYDRSGAEDNPQASLGNLTANIGVVLWAAKKGMAFFSFFCLGYGALSGHGNRFQRGCRHSAFHPPVTAEIHVLAKARGPPVVSNAPTKQATAHRPTKVEIAPNAASAPVEILVSVVACATELVRFLLFANDVCVMCASLQ